MRQQSNFHELSDVHFQCAFKKGVLGRECTKQELLIWHLEQDKLRTMFGLTRTVTRSLLNVIIKLKGLKKY